MKTLLFFTGTVFILCAFFIIMRGFAQSDAKNRQKIALETLSRLWSKRKEAVLTIEELAHIWRQYIPETEKRDFRHPLYLHAEINEFYELHIKGKVYFSGAAVKVIEEILDLLDREGDCPSVVNTQGEAEAHLDKDAYDILAQTTLLRHSLNVAVEMMHALGSSGPILPKALISAIGHDLGKLPSFRKTLYSMGDHPLITLTILEQVRGFRDLPYRNEIVKAIKDHHRSSRGLLGEALKEADQSARRKEMSVHVKTIREKGIYDNNSEQTIPVRNHTNAQGPSAHALNPDQQEKPDIFGENEEPGREKEKVTIKEVPLPWFDPDEFMEAIRPHINKLNGGRWDAFSMKDGYVYVQVKTIWETAKALARKRGDQSMLIGDSDEGLRRNILYTIVSRLRTEKDAIARGLIKDEYFGAPFIVRMRDGKEFTKGYYTPFKAEVFAERVSELERRKVGKIKDIVEVIPKFE